MLGHASIATKQTYTHADDLAEGLWRKWGPSGITSEATSTSPGDSASIGGVTAPRTPQYTASELPPNDRIPLDNVAQQLASSLSGPLSATGQFYLFLALGILSFLASVVGVIIS